MLRHSDCAKNSRHGKAKLKTCLLTNCLAFAAADGHAPLYAGMPTRSTRLPQPCPPHAAVGDLSPRTQPRRVSVLLTPCCRPFIGPDHRRRGVPPMHGRRPAGTFASPPRHRRRPVGGAAVTIGRWHPRVQVVVAARGSAHAAGVRCGASLLSRCPPTSVVAGRTAAAAAAAGNSLAAATGRRPGDTGTSVGTAHRDRRRRGGGGPPRCACGDGDSAPRRPCLYLSGYDRQLDGGRPWVFIDRGSRPATVASTRRPAAPRSGPPPDAPTRRRPRRRGEAATPRWWAVHS